MAFADPQSITISGAAVTLPRIADGSFANSDGTTILSVAHSSGKRTRRTIRIAVSKIAPDPLVSAQNIRHSMSAYLVVDVPVTGYTVAEEKSVIDGLIAFLSAASGAKLTQFLGGEA